MKMQTEYLKRDLIVLRPNDDKGLNEMFSPIYNVKS